MFTDRTDSGWSAKMLSVRECPLTMETLAWKPGHELEQLFLFNLWNLLVLSNFACHMSNPNP